MPASLQASGKFTARLTKTANGSGSPLTVAGVVGKPLDTPGNVGVCLSGGGSRAMCAGMGQLRALSYLSANNASLLSQVRAISTVSGGSWLGVTFNYLTEGATPENFLNTYVPDPGRLVPTKTQGHTPAETLDELPFGNIGSSIDTILFSPPLMAITAYLMYKYAKTPADMLWQTIVGLHILSPYDLYAPDDSLQPTSFFSYDQATLDRILKDNSTLGPETAHLIGPDGRYVICNSAMFVTMPGTKVQSLVPVQATPFFTGIVGKPGGKDANGRVPGGGGVTSFAFSSNLDKFESKLGKVEPDVVQVTQSRQWSLTDIVGTSSAFFAEIVQNALAEFEKDPEKFFEMMFKYAKEIWQWIEKHLPSESRGDLRAMLAAPREAVATRALGAEFAGLGDLIPAYQYWPVLNAAPASQTKTTRFADGGNLENTGVAGMLAYQDIDNIIAFVNTSERIYKAANGDIVIGSAIPPLFGYQPYNSGYKRYEGDSNPSHPMFRYSQVFDHTEFDNLLQALWKNSGNGSYATPAVATQTKLRVKKNDWFGVNMENADRYVNVVWVYLSYPEQWYNRLNGSVQEVLGPFKIPSGYSKFPNYATIKTNLSATESNLLANLTAWTVAADSNKGQFIDLFKPNSA